MKPTGTSTSPARALSAGCQRKSRVANSTSTAPPPDETVLSVRGVLELDLRVEHDPVVELVADVEDEADEVELVAGAVAVLGDGLEVRLAVAADREPALHAVDLRGRRAEAVVALQLLGLGQDEELADLAHLVGEDALPALDLLDALRLRRLRRRRRGRLGGDAGRATAAGAAGAAAAGAARSRSSSSRSWRSCSLKQLLLLLELLDPLAQRLLVATRRRRDQRQRSSTSASPRLPDIRPSDARN